MIYIKLELFIKVTFPSVLLLILCHAVPAHSQVFVNPTGFVFVPQPASVTFDERFVGQITISMQAGPNGDDSEEKAQQVFNAIHSRITATPPTLTEETVCIVMRHFGHDQASDDGANPSLDPDSPTRFFCLDDRNVLPSLDETDDQNGFPIHRATDGAARDARSYRHPFLLNSTEVAPLRTWCEQFVTELDDLCDGLYDPNKFRFYFECEAFIHVLGNQNGVFMLQYLANQSDIWNNWPVPGSDEWAPAEDMPPVETDTGKTLAELYAEERQRNGSWPLSILDGTSGIDSALPGTHARNRAFVIWWESVTQKTLDAVLWNCAYSVIKTQWSGAKCGNYDHSVVDGGGTTTSWYMGRVCPQPGSNPPSQCEDREPSTSFPRYWIDYSNQGGRMYEEVTGRWLSYTQHSSGDTYCPELYPLTLSHLDGHPCDPNSEGHRQPNLYDPEQPDDRYANSARLFRHNLEAIINSGSGGNETKLAIWISCVTTAFPDLSGCNSPTSFYVDEPWTLQTLALIRGKNAPELQFYFHTGIDTELIAVAWEKTLLVKNAVYAARVKQVTDLVGTPTVWVSVDEALEFTLLVDDAPLEVVIAAATDNSTEYATAIAVDFDSLGDYPSAEYDYVLNVECSTSDGATTGEIYVFDFDEEEWVQLAMEGMGGEYVFPDLPGHPTRQAFVIDGTAGELVSSTGYMYLKMVHLNTVEFTSSYDLVQVIPVPRGTWEDPESLLALQSDMNYNGEVSEEDYDRFMEAWWLEHPSADANRDNAVDNTDLQKFLNAYATEN